jgi:hypothetical protein
MDTDLSTFHAPEAAAEVVDEGCRRVYERGWIDIVRSRPVSTRTTSACQFVEGPLLADIVAKVENRMTPKIPRKPIFRDSCSRNAI